MRQLMESTTKRDQFRWLKDTVEFLSLTITESAKQPLKVCDVQIATVNANYGTASIFGKANNCDTCSTGFLSTSFCLSILQSLMSNITNVSYPVVVHPWPHTTTSLASWKRWPEPC